jgi:glutaredoxin-dependent peroxiredoxin
MSAEVGAKAPDFTLVNQDFQPVTLGTEIGKGHLVLAFFPAAFSSVCTREMCAFRDSMSQLNSLAATVYGISVDTPFALKAWADQQQLTFPLLSDFNKTVIRQYDVFNEDMIGLKGIARRALIAIDRAGIIRYRDVLANAGNEPDYEQLKRALAQMGR